jgi:hypothetical protein
LSRIHSAGGDGSSVSFIAAHTTLASIAGWARDAVDQGEHVGDQIDQPVASRFHSRIGCRFCPGVLPCNFTLDSVSAVGERRFRNADADQRPFMIQFTPSHFFCGNGELRREF